MHTFRTAEEIVSGSGTIESLGERAAGLGRKVLLVTGRSAMRRTGTADRALSLLRAAGIEAAVFDQVEHDPDVSTIEAGRARCREESCGLVIGLGGGSAMDAAKAIAGLAKEPGAVAEYHQGRDIAQRALPIVAVPTTSGTGSEVTKVAVLSDRSRGIKKSIRADTMWPAVALVDPELTVSCPPGVTAASGADALVQAIESYTSLHATPLTEALSFDAARRLLRWLEVAYRDGTHREAREQCAYASMMAGMALANARLGAVHGIAHPLGARTGLAHGVACALLMPHVMRLNRHHVGGKYDRLSEAAGADIVDRFERMNERLGLAEAQTGLGIQPDDIPDLVAQSMPSGSLKANPKKMTEEDVATVLKALAGS
ncbi:MAG: iron-containing alcohol dehydrogenase family protein [Candidatus Brocadiia bacterium]